MAILSRLQCYSNNNDVPTRDYKDNNKNNKSNNVIINQAVPRKMSTYFLCKIGLSRDINKDSFNCDLNTLLSFKSIEKLSKLAL